MKHDENILYDSNNRFLMKSYFSTAGVRSNEFRIHHHAECELSAIISGNGVYHVKDKTYEFGAGSVFLFSGDEEHCITDIYNECEILNIHFVPRLLWSDDLCLSRIFFARSEKYESRIDPDNPITDAIFNTILDIEKELSTRSYGYKSMAKYKLLWAITQLVREYDYIDNSVNYSNFRNTIQPIETALCYIDKNLTRDMTLAEIAESAAMSPSYFSSVFKKLNGISLWEYITAKRVEHAIELIKSTNMTKLDIALSCGFSSSSNFYKAFFKVTGKKPSDYNK